MKGWKTHSNYGDSYLDEKRYWPILEKAAELGAPIYLHPDDAQDPRVLDVRSGLGRARASASGWRRPWPPCAWS